MATRLKTVEYWFPLLATAADNTDTDFSQITLDLPESTKVFKSVFLEVVYHDANTTLTGTCGNRQLSLRLGSASYTAVNNTSTIAYSGENYISCMSADFLAHFTANWSGTSMTCDARFLYDMSTATPLGARNISARLIITYSYDDTSATQVKTVWMPLNAPTGALATSKPGSAIATLRNLSSYLPEAGVSIKQLATIVQGNTHGTSTDLILRWQYDTQTAFASQSIEHGGNQSMAFRIHNVESVPTNASYGFYLWGSSAVFNHLQAWVAVTYTFTISGTTSVLNSLLLPMDIPSPFGNSSTNYQRAKLDFYIQEPATITKGDCAFFLFWDEPAVMAGLNARIGTGSFITYTDLNMADAAGGTGLMIVDPGTMSLARGKNTLQIDVYRTDTLENGHNSSGFWMINYVSGIHADGVGAHNHTCFHLIEPSLPDAPILESISASVAPDIPETDFFMTNVGFHLTHTQTGSTATKGGSVGIERLSGEGGLAWENVWDKMLDTDAEHGIRQTYSQSNHFKCYTGCVDSTKLDIETARKYRMCNAGPYMMNQLLMLFTYHSIKYTVSGTISGSNSGTVNLMLCRHSDNKPLRSTSRSGNGAYSITWYDNTEEVYVDAYEDSTHVFRSNKGYAS